MIDDTLITYNAHNKLIIKTNCDIFKRSKYLFKCIVIYV